MGTNLWSGSDYSDITFMADETREQVVTARAEFQRRHAEDDHEQDEPVRGTRVG